MEMWVLPEVGDIEKKKNLILIITPQWPMRLLIS